MIVKPLEVFEGRISEAGKRIAGIDGLLDRIAFLRLGVFSLGLVAVIWTWTLGSWYPVPATLGFFLAFGLIVKWNIVVLARKHYQEVLQQINREEILRLEGKIGGFRGGEEFVSAEHPYSGDMDLFGHHSLFQLLNRTETVFGKHTLAEWLQHPAAREEGRLRQDAVMQLSEEVGWRQDFQATGRLFEDSGEKPAALKAWMEEAPVVLGNSLYNVISFVLPAIAWITILLVILGILPWWAALFPFVFNFSVNRSLGKMTENVYENTYKRARLLRSYSGLIDRIEALEDKSGLVKDLQGKLQSGGARAGEEIRKLSKIMLRLEMRMNGMVYVLLNNFFFWDLHWIRALDRWRLSHGSRIMDWFEVIGQVESLNSMAGLRFAERDWCMPVLSEADLQVTGVAIGHPLIPTTGRVSNDFDIHQKGEIWLITGSNMSGKSTFLRTLGINAVLAMMGAPACAESFCISPLFLVSSMRTLDSIEESTSSFYAELKRLKLVLESVKSEKAVFFLLDEILKGTNSHDRHTGARALIRQLQKQGGSGLVSTHDVELQDLAVSLPGAVKNYSFHCEVTAENRLVFDYKIAEGVCRSMNASQLMRGIGIEME